MPEKRRRTISSDLQIYFDESSKAHYRSAAGRDLAAVKLELEAWREFVEEWLQAVEEPVPMTSDQRQLRRRIETSVTVFKGPAMLLSNEEVAGILKARVPTWQGQFKNLKLEQVESIVDDVIDCL